MLISKMLFTCIMNERDTEFHKIRKCTVALLRYFARRTPEQKKAQYQKISEKKEKWWVETSQKKLDKMCKQRGESLKKYLAGLTAEERKIRAIPAKKAFAVAMKDPVRGPELSEIYRKCITKYNNAKIIEKTSRVNDYCGVVSMKELEKI